MLADAVAKLQAGEAVAALHVLQSLWGDNRSPLIAERIERLGKLLSAELPDLDDGSPNEEGDWLVLASRGRSVDMERLLRHFDIGTSRVIATRLDRLRDRPPDPRVTQPLLAFASVLPFSSSPSRRVWTAWFRMVRHVADPRFGPGLEAMIATATARLNVDDPPRWLEFEHFLLNRLRPVLTGLPEPRDPGDLAPLDSAIDAFSAQGPPPIHVLLTEPRSAVLDLYDRLLEDPNDTSAMAVWADAISERGDPRGEFTAIQLIREKRPLTGPELTQERRLYTRHRNRWLGPLDAVVDSSMARFRRGLLEAALVRVQTEAQRNLLDLREWRTVKILQTTTAHLKSRVANRVERIGMRMLPDDDGLVLGPPGFVWRDLAPPTWTQFTALASSAEPFPFKAVCTALPGTPTSAQASALEMLRGLPQLEDLHLVDTARWYRRQPSEAGLARLGDLVIAQTLARVRRLVLDGIAPVPGAPDSHWWSGLSAAPQLQELVLIGSGPWIRSYRFAEEGVHVTISKTGNTSFVPAGSQAGLRTLGRTLAAYLGPAGQFASIRVRSRSLPIAELEVFSETLAACRAVHLPRLYRPRGAS